MDGAAAVKKERQDLEVAKHTALAEINEAQAKHDADTAATDKRLAAKLVEIEARERRVQFLTR
jgi:hypothetical protein